MKKLHRKQVEDRLKSIDDARRFLETEKHLNASTRAVTSGDLEYAQRTLTRNLEELYVLHIPIHFNFEVGNSYIVEEECLHAVYSKVEEEELARLNRLNKQWIETRKSQKKDELAQRVQDQIEKMQALGMKIKPAGYMSDYEFENAQRW